MSGRIYSLALILCAIFSLTFGTKTASAAESATASAGTYPVFSDGTAAVEIGISAGNEILMENENMTVTIPNDKHAFENEDLTAYTHAEYELYNSDALTAYAAVAVVRLLKVETVNLTAEEAKSFVSGETIMAGDSAVSGRIYAIGSPEKIKEESAYDTCAEAMANLNYEAYIDEAVAKYGITSLSSYERATIDTGKNVLENQPADYLRVSENGEEKLCVVVYNIEVPAMDSLTLTVDNEVKGVMKRPTKYSPEGTSYSFYFTGSPLSTFYGASGESYVFNLPQLETLGFLNSDAPYYLDNNVYSARFKGAFAPFSFTVGTELTAEEVKEINAEHGSMKKIIGVIDIVVLILIIPAAVYIVVEIRKRRASGIGMDRKNYF